MKINRLKQLIIAACLMLTAYTKAQSPAPLAVQILNPVFVKDTVKANQANRHLHFTVNVNAISSLKSFKVELTDKTGNLITDLGTYQVKKHETGFYYAESDTKDKKTVFNTDIFFSNLIKAAELKQITNIRLNYVSIENQTEKVNVLIPKQQ
jgi:hypothetical protein